MKKIACVFERDFTDRRNPVLLQSVTPSCAWVLAGQGRATRKWDGTACAIIDGELYARLDCKNGKVPPPGARPCDDPDPVTGHWPHWVLANRPEDKWIREAFENSKWTEDLRDGTYEAVGPRINGNPERFPRHLLVPHGAHDLQVLRDFDGIRDFLQMTAIEGIVFHHTDGRMAKIRRADFGFPWPGVCR